ncbi:MAG: universal stress protein, partial [Gemmatimonadetes bacterium]|nr:universal stress protein [Gemmatimonadota bacterium]NIQ59644.1 universal stress protein [Gemmatimonadota bacterium]NIU74004.1 universal stress protein [Gammaproteobacteria bacterium]NIX44063.1 universal stress protein [Gemmatimonadota bacterium]NIY07428.1 universal stress protein [Gemmatimonadota bacterium]
MRFDRILYLEPHAGRSSRTLPSARRIARDHGASLTVRWRRDEALRDALGEHDLVVTVAGRDTLRWPLRYAPAERELIHSCGCPVWVLHPAQSGPIRVVLAGVDVSREAEEARAARVVRTAARLAEGAGAELHLVHAYSITGESLIRSPGRGGSRGTLERALRTEAAQRRARLDRIVARERVHPVPEVVLRHGRTVAILEQVAWERQADLVVVGAAPPRARLGRLLFPPVAEQLLGRVHASIAV